MSTFRGPRCRARKYFLFRRRRQTIFLFQCLKQAYLSSPEYTGKLFFLQKSPVLLRKFSAPEGDPIADKNAVHFRKPSRELKNKFCGNIRTVALEHRIRDPLLRTHALFHINDYSIFNPQNVYGKRHILHPHGERLNGVEQKKHSFSGTD